MSENKAKQTSSVATPIDIAKTNDTTHVYMKVDTPLGLTPKYEGPYKIISRPSRSQIQIRVGSYANGLPRLLTVHWSLCKPAHMREGAAEASRPNVGRRSASSDSPNTTDAKVPGSNMADSNKMAEPITSAPSVVEADSRVETKSETRFNTRPIRSTRN